jgi:hypothetical protein
MEELERSNQQKRQGQITIKTMRRGKVRGVTQEKFETDSTGRVKMLDKRIVRYHETQFPALDEFFAKEGSQ